MYRRWRLNRILSTRNHKATRLLVGGLLLVILFLQSHPCQAKKRLWSFGTNTGIAIPLTASNGGGPVLPTWEQSWFEESEIISFTISSGLLESIYSLMQNLEGITALDLDIKLFIDFHIRCPPACLPHWIIVSLGGGIDFKFKPPENDYQVVAALRLGYEFALAQGRLGVRLVFQPLLAYGHEPNSPLPTNGQRPFVFQPALYIMIGLHSYALK